MSEPRDAGPTYLAIDIGASSGRAVLGTLAGGRMEMHEVHRFRTPLIEADGHLYWDAEALWAETRAALTQALQAAPGLRSVSVDTWAVDYVPIGFDGAPLRNPYSYRDLRTAGRLAEALRLVGGADAVYARTGIQFLEFNTLPQIVADVRDEPALVARTATRLLIADYLLYLLSGELVAERTIASTTQLLDARNGGWAEDMIGALGDAPERWPRLVAPGTVLGPVRGAALPASRSNAPLVLATCSHDTAAAVAAVPAEGDRPWAYISSGTWSLIGGELRAPLLVRQAREAGFTNEAGLDGTVRFLKNRTGMWVLEECVREWAAADGGRPSYDALLTAAAASPPLGGTIDLNAPEFAQRGDMEGKVAAACRAAGMAPPDARGPLVRLVLESLAESYRRVLAQLDALTGAAAEVVHVVGGGARNGLLNQLTADACARPVVAGPDEATALGNLLVQARTLGDLPAGVSVRDAARRSAGITTYRPSSVAPARTMALSQQ